MCGVTVYDHSHLGHARAAVAYDVVLRSLLHRGYEVVYARNFTDVDDKIIARARREGSSEREVAERYVRSYREDVRGLNCLDPTLEPRATRFVDAMVADIQRIVDSGHGYVVEAPRKNEGAEPQGDAASDRPPTSGRPDALAPARSPSSPSPLHDVFFDVESLPAYGQLSGRTAADSRPGERVEVDARKRSPRDFALWKAAAPGEPVWPSPWGPGRPGWHIECSAMIRALLGDPIDIHGGGSDLIFPHHENERAQAIACKESEEEREARAGAAKEIAHHHAGCCSHAHAEVAAEQEATEKEAAGTVKKAAEVSASKTATSPSASSGTAASPSASPSSSSSSSSPPPSLARFWVHNGFVTVDSEKMSKSLGNFSTVKDVLARHHPAALRWLLVSTHYRAPLAFSQRALEDAANKVYDLAAAVAAARDVLAGGDGEAGRAERNRQGAIEDTMGKPHEPGLFESEDQNEQTSTGDSQTPRQEKHAPPGSAHGDAPASPAPRPFSAEVASQAPLEALQGLSDDLGTPAAVAVAVARVKTINDALQGAKKEMKKQAEAAAADPAAEAAHRAETPSSPSSSSSVSKRGGKKGGGRGATAARSKTEVVRTALSELEGCAELLGLDLADPESLLASLRAKALSAAGLSEDEVWAALDARAEARARKDYAEADRARKELEERGILVMDGVRGTSWRPGTGKTEA